MTELTSYEGGEEIMRKGETTKVCPGCGEQGLRNSDEVCASID